MPIRLLSPPSEDLKYALNCMDIEDLIAFSLCSKQTKNLVKSSNREIKGISFGFGNRFGITIQQQNNHFIHLEFSDSWNKLWQRNGSKVWREHIFTPIEWIAHFQSIFNDPMIQYLSIAKEVSPSYMDTIKQIIPKFHTLHIDNDCSAELTKIAFRKFIFIPEKVEIDNRYPFDNENDMPQFFSLNLKSVTFNYWRSPFKLNASHLLMTNIENLLTFNTNITEKELNRFVKLWMKSNHRFYRPKYMELHLKLRKEMDREEILRGINYQTEKHDCLLKRKDGKEMLLWIGTVSVHFKFRG
ncbi:unnamed protein product [Caenorhabditis nigoni]